MILILGFCTNMTRKTTGKTKETCKWRDCKYEVVVTIGYDGMNEIIEVGQHTHSLDYYGEKYIEIHALKDMSNTTIYLLQESYLYSGDCQPTSPARA